MSRDTRQELAKYIVADLPSDVECRVRQSVPARAAEMYFTAATIILRSLIWFFDRSRKRVTFHYKISGAAAALACVGSLGICIQSKKE
jgi:hypothetical protein